MENVNTSLPLKTIFRALRSSRAFLYKLKNGNEERDCLISFISNLDEDSKWSSKDVIAALNISYSKYQKLLKELYKDFVNGTWSSVFFEFTKIEYTFIIKSTERTHTVRCKFPVTPHIGEEISLPFPRWYI